MRISLHAILKRANRRNRPHVLVIRNRWSRYEYDDHHEHEHDKTDAAMCKIETL